MAKEPEVLPALDNTNYQDKEFVPIKVDDTDRTVTIQDLDILNMFIHCSLKALPNTRSIEGLTKLQESALKLIEGRRNVMKLPYGSNKVAPKKQGRTIEVLD